MKRTLRQVPTFTLFLFIAAFSSTARSEMSEIDVDAGSDRGVIENTADLNWYHDPYYEIQPRYQRLWIFAGGSKNDIPAEQEKRRAKVIGPDLSIEGIDVDRPESYNFVKLDELLDELSSRNVKPYPLIQLDKSYYQKLRDKVIDPEWFVENSEKIARSMARILYHITSDDLEWSGRGMKVDHVELWNEPSVGEYWPSGWWKGAEIEDWPVGEYSKNNWECLVDIIELAITDMRELCGDEIQIGAWAGPPFPAALWADERILELMSGRSPQVDLDFYSWHDYRVPPGLWDFDLLREQIESTRRRLHKAGYDIPQHITEWNNIQWCSDPAGAPLNCGEPGWQVNPWYHKLEAAAYTAEYLVNTQDIDGVEVLHRWNGGADPFGIYSDDETPYRRPVFHSYTFFERLVDNRRLTVSPTEYTVLAGKIDDKVHILIAADPFNTTADEYRLLVSNLDTDFTYAVVKIAEVDLRGELEVIEEGSGSGELEVTVATEDYAVHFVEIEKSPVGDPEEDTGPDGPDGGVPDDDGGPGEEEDGLNGCSCMTHGSGAGSALPFTMMVSLILLFLVLRPRQR